MQDSHQARLVCAKMGEGKTRLVARYCSAGVGKDGRAAPLPPWTRARPDTAPHCSGEWGWGTSLPAATAPTFQLLRVSCSGPPLFTLLERIKSTSELNFFATIYFGGDAPAQSQLRHKEHRRQHRARSSPRLDVLAARSAAEPLAAPQMKGNCSQVAVDLNSLKRLEKEMRTTWFS